MLTERALFPNWDISNSHFKKLSSKGHVIAEDDMSEICRKSLIYNLKSTKCEAIIP